MNKISNKDFKKKLDLWMKLHNHEILDCLNDRNVNETNCKFFHSDVCTRFRRGEMVHSPHRFAIIDKDGNMVIKTSDYSPKKETYTICLGFLELE